VAEAVVDTLEVVEVEQHEGDRRARVRAPTERVLDSICQERPVGETGERIVERAMA
jgi:hypothetical protein